MPADWTAEDDREFEMAPPRPGWLVIMLTS